MWGVRGAEEGGGGSNNIDAYWGEYKDQVVFAMWGMVIERGAM
jgi:hypothetical protein